MWLPMFCCLGNQEADDDLNSDDEEAEGVGSNPIVRTYLIPNEHGSCRRYWAEFVLVVGLVLPWMGPIGSLCVASPFIKLGVQQSQVITPDTDCYGSAYAVCDAASYFDYYFWNVTNAEEWFSGLAPPALQEIGPYAFLVQEVRFNPNYSQAFSEVDFSFYNFQTFVPEQSCQGCTLNDTFVGINRAYQQLLQGAAGYEIALLIPSVPLVLQNVIGSFIAILETNGVPAAYAPTYAAQQWAQCNVFPAAAGAELCNWAENVQHIPAAYATAALPMPGAAQVLSALMGNASLNPSPSSADPAAVSLCELVAFGPTATVAATLFLPTTTVQLLQGYLFWVAETFVAPQFAGILGTPLGPTSGGMLAKRTIYQWLYGWVDPVLATSLGADNPVAQVALQFAWESQGAPEARFGVDVTQLSPKMSPLIGSRRVDTGKARATIPSQALLANGLPVVTTFSGVLPPLGNISVAGADNGLTFGLAVEGTSAQLVFDGTLGRPVNTTETGIEQDVKSVKAEQWTLAWDALAPCNLSDWHSAASSRCAFPDNIQGSWNQTQVYACPTILTLARFNRADPALMASTGNNFTVDNSSHGWTYAMEMTTGYSIAGSKTFQLSHQIKRTDVFYKNLWMSPGSPNSMWFPSFWVRSRYEPSDHDAKSLANMLRIRGYLITFLTYVAPGVSGALLLPAAWFLVLCPAAKERRATMEMLCKSRARRLRLKIRHAHQPGPRFGVPNLKPDGKLPPLSKPIPSPAEVTLKVLKNPLEALAASSAETERMPMIKAAVGVLGQLSGT